ncbi:hypothetical protein [Alteromonas sp. CYL-A6]|uniref:hypothetical protein n=1 Tax=Alteromonas nitratireducens TaxID=3390813 RepID=UPI0034B1FD07
MNINTQLTLSHIQDAYKAMVTMLFARPLVVVLIVALASLLDVIPDAVFPAKMAAYAAAMTLLTVVITTLYRRGSWRGVLTELRFQMGLLVPAVLLIMVLSLLGFAVAQWLGADGATTVSSPPPASLDTMTWMIAGLATGLIAVAQILPYVLAHFCRGLTISREQGEQIWVRLMLNPLVLLSFTPLSFLMVVCLVLKSSAAWVFLLGATYSCFLLFTVFNIPQAPERQAHQAALTQPV